MLAERDADPLTFLSDRKHLDACRERYAADPKRFKLDKKQKETLRKGTFYGKDIVDSVVRLCVMNLYLHGIDAELDAAGLHIHHLGQFADDHQARAGTALVRIGEADPRINAMDGDTKNSTYAEKFFKKLNMNTKTELNGQLTTYSSYKKLARGN